jgi:D-lactate dehydrogenase
MQRSLDGLRRVSGGRLPKWSPTLARPVHFVPGPRRAPAAGAKRIVYFPSCAARNMGAQRGHEVARSLPAVAERLFAKAGFAVAYPERLAELCCGQPFESKGLAAAADRKSAELEAALREASEDGRWPIVFDTSPCAYRMQRYLGGRLAVLDSIEFIDEHVLPRVTVEPVAGPVAVHPVCSVRKMDTVERLLRIAGRCSSEVVTVDAVMCCGFAGDKGFTRPELNEHALRHLKSALPPQCATGYSTSRTCEIGLSEQAGFPYQSIIHLVDACATAGPAGKEPTP